MTRNVALRARKEGGIAKAVLQAVVPSLHAPLLENVKCTLQEAQPAVVLGNFKH